MYLNHALVLLDLVLCVYLSFFAVVVYTFCVITYLQFDLVNTRFHVS